MTTNLKVMNLPQLDTYFGGTYRVVGTVDRLGVVGRHNVNLFTRLTRKLIGSSYSDVSGAYAFNYIKYISQGYFAVAFDSSETKLNAAIADLITPEPIP